MISVLIGYNKLGCSIEMLCGRRQGNTSVIPQSQHHPLYSPDLDIPKPLMCITLVLIRNILPIIQVLPTASKR